MHDRRTIWELLAEAVAALPEPFGRRDVLDWFAAHNPDVNPSSVSTHLQMATSNASEASKLSTYARRIPLVTRIGHGRYVRFGSEQQSDEPEPAPRPSSDHPRTAHPDSEFSPKHDVALVGCGRSKRSTPTRAADLYVSAGFGKRKAVAEACANQWFILSAEHALVDPDEWLVPYDTHLADTSPHYREAWGRWAVARLARKMGGLENKTVLVLAPAAYANAVRGPLHRLGAKVSEPLAGLRQGEQNAWMSAELGRLGLQGPALTTAPRVTLDEAVQVDDASDDDQRIARALLEFRRTSENLHESRLGYAMTAEADALLQRDPFAFLLGVVLDEGILAERAWQGPWELQQRLGTLDPWLLRTMHDDISLAVSATPALHRYVEIMAEAITVAASRVCSAYDGDASRIWAPGLTAAEVDRRLQEFRRIGPKKAAMAVELLITHFGVELADLGGSNVAYDIHVRRVFLRSGIVDVDDRGVVTGTARRLSPERPGLLDLPTWIIGRRYCHSQNPNCGECPLSTTCRKLVDRNVRA